MPLIHGPACMPRPDVPFLQEAVLFVDGKPLCCMADSSAVIEGIFEHVGMESSCAPTEVTGGLTEKKLDTQEPMTVQDAEKSLSTSAC